MPTPEQLARMEIDRQLDAAGWQVQDYASRSLGAGKGVAVREFPLRSGFADYLLFVERKAIGVVEAKPGGFTLMGVEQQTAKYSTGLPPSLPAWHKPLPFLYQASGVETRFTDLRDPEPRSRRVFLFHQPETLARWAKEAQTLRARLREMPPLVPGRLWSVQIQTIQNLETSLARNDPRALVHMATGSGKTFTAVSLVYRLIKHARAARVLFLVDRTNLGQQALTAFQQYETPDDGRKFNELYNVQHMTTNTLDKGSKVTIATIQRLYSLLSGEELDETQEEVSLWEQEEQLASAPKLVSYNPAIPPESFDLILIDECHRSIYNLWRQVLEYFDAFLIGLTATPSGQSYAFFNQNLVQEYSRQDAVADGINVDGWVYRIRTRITEQGSRVDSGELVQRRDRRSQAARWETLDEELTYEGGQLDREVVSMSQIRTVIRTFKEKLETELFPGRSMVPKTLIFAKDDLHAERITEIVREEFGKGNEFCEKITYRVTGGKSDELIRAFRNSPNPRIAVTVDMIATGTDIKPLEILLFMRQVKSALLFEQMLGRGTRVIDPSDLAAISGPEATSKEFFVIVDAVGVVEHPRVDTGTLNRKRSLSLKHILELVTDGQWDEDTLLTLAGRLGTLARGATAEDEAGIREASGGLDLRELAHELLGALDPDRERVAAQLATGLEEPPPEAIAEAGEQLRAGAGQRFADNPALRERLLSLQGRNEYVIDHTSVDMVREAGFSESATEMARELVRSFEQYLAEHRDEIDALQILFSQPYAQERLTFRHIKALAEQLQQPPHRWTPELLWQAYARLEQGRVRGTQATRTLTDLVSLVRHATHPEQELVPYPEQVQARYVAWLEQQETMGRRFTPEQRELLDRIAQQIGVSLAVEPRELDTLLHDRGGRVAVDRVLGSDWAALLEELNQVLAA